MRKICKNLKTKILDFSEFKFLKTKLTFAISDTMISDYEICNLVITTIFQICCSFNYATQYIEFYCSCSFNTEGAKWS